MSPQSGVGPHFFNEIVNWDSTEDIPGELENMICLGRVQITNKKYVSRPYRLKQTRRVSYLHIFGSNLCSEMTKKIFQRTGNIIPFNDSIKKN